jgi:hypothetical protein
VRIFLLQATILLLQATAILVLCVVLQVNILHHHLDLQVQDLLVLLGLLRLLLVHLVLGVLLAIGIGIIGWEGMGWTSHLLLLGMIDQGHLVLWDDIRMVEAAAAAAMDVETHVTEVDMEDLENMLLFLFCFSFSALSDSA